MKNYVLARSWARANVQDREYYCMTEADKNVLAQEGKIEFGDKVLVLKTGKVYVMGNDGIWYAIGG